MMKKWKASIVTACVALLIGAGLFFAPSLSLPFEVLPGSPLSYSTSTHSTTTEPVEPEEPEPLVTHMDTPESVRAMYVTSWTAGTPSRIRSAIELIEETEINSIVIDIKDYSGKIAFPIDDERVSRFNGAETRIADVRALINRLHEKDIYVIGRVSVFQDPHLAGLRPEWAVKSARTGAVWEDNKGLSWIDPGVRAVWDYHVAIAEGSYELGFDEINFDYVRFPSDGDMSDLHFDHFDSASSTKPDQIEDFFAYLDRELADTPVKTSADLFGLTTTARSSLNIGQVLERAAPYFDYLAPMVYPSHFAPGSYGIARPAERPYEVINHSMSVAAERLRAASTTARAELRPWLQDFDLGAEYTPERVRAQIDATYDVGLDSWMLWDPSNTYTREALLTEEEFERRAARSTSTHQRE